MQLVHDEFIPTHVPWLILEALSPLIEKPSCPDNSPENCVFAEGHTTVRLVPTNLPWTMVKLASGLRAISPAGKGCYTNTHVKG